MTGSALSETGIPPGVEGAVDRPLRDNGLTPLAPMLSDLFAVLDAPAEPCGEVHQRLGQRSFADRFPDVLEAYLVGSRAGGDAAIDSDYDVVLLVRGDGALSLSKREEAER